MKKHVKRITTAIVTACMCIMMMGVQVFASNGGLSTDTSGSQGGLLSILTQATNIVFVLSLILGVAAVVAIPVALTIHRRKQNNFNNSAAEDDTDEEYEEYEEDEE